MTKFVLTTDDAVKARGWIVENRGVRIWTSQDLSISRPDIITPGDIETSPHWAYVGSFRIADTADFVVVDRKPITLPPEWFPACEYCNGKGLRTIAEIAEIRGQSIESAEQSLRSDSHLEFINGESFKCVQCHGTGATIKTPEFRVKRLPPYKGGGMECSATGINKCVALCRKLEQYYKLPENSVQWDWEYIGYGMGSSFFYSETESQFV